MKRAHLWSIPIVAVAVAFAAPLILSAKSGLLQTKENDGGSVRVSVTPEDLSKSATDWRFQVRFNTHVTPIVQDMLIVTSLTGNQAAGEKPLKWEGDPPGGHHRRGVLVFKPITPAPSAVTLHIREVGGIADRSFTWNLNSP